MPWLRIAALAPGDLDVLFTNSGPEAVDTALKIPLAYHYLAAKAPAERYGVLPDMITFAKGVTSGTVPMGGVIVRQPIYETFMNGPEHAIELLHGYTCSGHLLACAAGLAALDLDGKEDLFARALRLEPLWGDDVHGLKGLPNALDIRNAGLSAAIDLGAKPGAPGKQGFDAMDRAFHDFDLLLRGVGDTLILTPPLIVNEAQIGEIVEKTARAIKAVARSMRRARASRRPIASDCKTWPESQVM